MPAPEPAFARRWRTKFNAALARSTAQAPASSSTGYYFPLAQYLSLHLVLSIFLLFSLGFLPRSQTWLEGVLPASWTEKAANGAVKQVISADRPELEFLTPLTANVVVTLSWTCAGLVVCMTWWGAHLRRWWVAFRQSEGKVAQDDTVLVRSSLLRAEHVLTLHAGSAKSTARYSRRHSHHLPLPRTPRRPVNNVRPLPHAPHQTLSPPNSLP